MVARWLLVLFLVISAAALWWPDPFQAVTGSQLSGLIFVAMFFIGAMLPPEEIRGVARRWPSVLSGTAVQYLSMPLLAYLFGTIWQLNEADFFGIILVGCVPGAMASNVITINARGNASYSVGLTTLATLLSPVAVPVTMGLALQRWDDAQRQLLLDAAVTLLWSVVLPVILGFITARVWRSQAARLVQIGPAVANLAILWVIATVIAKNRDYLQLDPALVSALVCVNVSGYAAGYLGGYLIRLDEPMRRALTVEVGMQNAGLGSVLALRLFDDERVAVAPALYMFGCMLTGTLLAQAWAWRDDRAA